MLRGHGQMLAQQRLQSYEKGEVIQHRPVDGTKTLRVVGGYRHLGAMATAALRFPPEVSARAIAAQAIEKSLTKSMCLQSRLPRTLRVAVA